MSSRKLIIRRSISALIAAALVIGCIALAVSSEGNQKTPQKTVSLKVMDGDGKTTSYKFETNCIYLMDALKTDSFCEGEMREEGFWITRVADIEASDNEHWQIHIDGKLTAKKADKIKIEDNSSYILKLISSEKQ